MPLFFVIALNGCDLNPKTRLSELPVNAFECQAKPQPPVWPYTQKDVAKYCVKMDNAYEDCYGKLNTLKELR